MNIKMTSYRAVFSPLLFPSCFLQKNSLAQELFVPTVNNSNSVAEVTFRQIPTILFESVVVLDENNLIPLLPGIYRLGNFKYEFTPGALSSFYTTESLTAGRIYKLVRELDTDGF